MMNISLKQLQVFQSVATHLNFHRAAEALYISQPAVTKHVQALESVVGFKLFEKLGKKVFLTARGRSMLLEVDRLLKQFNSFKEIVVNDISKQQCFSLAVLPSLQDLVVDAMIDFVKIHPAVKVDMSVVPNDEIQHVINADQFDLYLAVNFESMPDYCSELLFTTPFCLAASANHPLRYEKKINKNDLKDEVFIEIDISSYFKKKMSDFKQRYGIAKHSRINIQGRHAVIKAVAAGLGVSLLPWFSIKSQVDAGEICVLNIDTSEYNGDYAFVYHKDKKLSAEVFEFLKILKRKIELE